MHFARVLSNVKVARLQSAESATGQNQQIIFPRFAQCFHLLRHDFFLFFRWYVILYFLFVSFNQDDNHGVVIRVLKIVRIAVREGPGVNYALNWALCAKGIAPKGEAYRNLRGSELKKLNASIPSTASWRTGYNTHFSIKSHLIRIASSVSWKL